MRNYTDCEYKAIKENPYERKIIRQQFTSALVDYLVKYQPLEEAQKIIKLINKKYNHLWDLADGFEKVPEWEEILDLIEKEYGTYKKNN